MSLGNSDFGIEKIKELLGTGQRKIYFIGIGGVSMSSLAALMLKMGHTVLGSDVAQSSITRRIKAAGADISYIQNGEHLRAHNPDLCVYSLSASEENRDVAAARALGICLVSRAELLGYAASLYKCSFAVSGSHGKSTVTALLTKIFTEAKREPTALLGAPGEDGACELLGSERYLVFESCEYKNSFLKPSPDYQLILNLDYDHTDFFKTPVQLEKSFLECADRARRFTVLPYGNKALVKIRNTTSARTVTFGEEEGADYRYKVLGCVGARYEFELFCGRVSLGRIKMRAAGKHNMENCVAAVVTAHHSGVKFSCCKSAAESFLPPGRRGERLGRIYGADVIYDYAHHPAEISATLAALSEMGYKSICTVFRPHTYSRTGSLFDEFAHTLSVTRVSVITDIYAAREKKIQGISSELLAARINELGGKGIYLSEGDIFPFIKRGEYDCIVLMGAGNLDIIKKDIEQNEEFQR